MGNRQRHLAEAVGAFVPAGRGRVPVGRLVCARPGPGGGGKAATGPGDLQGEARGREPA